MFYLQDMKQERFTTFDQVLAFVSEEKRQIVRIPLKSLWDDGARFVGDRILGCGYTALDFNSYGLKALCSLVGVSQHTLCRLDKADLASDLLNDILGTEIKNNGKASVADIMVDEETNTIIGIVSNKYLVYSNDTFLRDLLTCLDENNNGALFPDTGRFDFKEAYSINSQLYVRMTSKTVSGTITGYDGKSEDRSEIGVEVSNTMAGGRAVRLSWFVYRLICANGLVSPVSGSKGRVIHTGSENSFRRRLNTSANGLFGSLGKVKKMIENLGSIPFDPHKLAKHADLRLLFSIVPGLDLKNEAFAISVELDDCGYAYQDKNEQITCEAIATLPYCLGGKEALAVFDSEYRDNASMYDFINIFTEYAKTLSHKQKIDVETNAGTLAAWIAKNRRKFT